MNRLSSALVVALCAVAGALTTAGPSVASPPVDPLMLQLLAGTPDAPKCVSEYRLHQLDESHARVAVGAHITGLTFLPGKQMYLLNSVCRNVAGFMSDTRHGVKYLPIWEVDAMLVLFHEAAHAHGIASEWKAECTGLHMTLWQIAQFAPKTYEHWRDTELIIADYNRDPAYKIAGRCNPPRTAHAALVEAGRA